MSFFDDCLVGYTPPGIPPLKGKLSSLFVVPPFSVLNARDGAWQDRKAAWIKFGIRGQKGRVKATRPGSKTNKPGKDASRYKGGDCWLGTGEKKYGQTFKIGDKRKWDKEHQGKVVTHEEDMESGTSVFDPVLCELMYRWFCPSGGHILDPFAGGSTRGIVASALGFKYTGIEIRQDQVEANREQAQITKTTPEWILGDSHEMNGLLPTAYRLFDMVWTCPPYFDLEIYSECREDGSCKQSYEEFLVWYEHIFKSCVDRLKDNRFLAVTVGEIRDKNGIYRNFIGDNISCFKRLGLHYYNELILVTMVGSLPIRTKKQFGHWRKIGKTHQQCLLFFKGDVKMIKSLFGKI